MHWPVEYGGRGATLTQSAIFFEELGRSGAPLPANVLGLLLAGPTIMTWGTHEQKERYLTPILTAEEIWCQGFSEPDAGSDLAAVKTRAVKDGDEWVVTGQKVWTSGAQYSKWCMLVARTDTEAPKHKGLTYFLMDMEQEAVQVRPLRQITGEPEFNELFIDGARIPDENVLGGVGNGWKVALTTLMNERAGLAFFLQVRLRQLLDQLIEEAAARGLLDDPVVADRLGELHLKAEVLRLTAYRGLTAIEKYGQPGPGGLADQVDVVGDQPAADPVRRRSARPRRADGRQPLVLRAAARPRQLDRGRHHRGAQEHRRRARARPARRPAEEAGMDFDLTEDQQEIKRVARELLARALADGAGARGGRGRRLRRARCGREMVELGWPGIAVAEEHGGQGLGAVELAVLLEELGYACAATPFLSTAVAAAVIQAAGTDEQRERWLPGLVSGELTRRRRPRRPGRRRRRAPRGRAARRRRRACWWPPRRRAARRRSTRPAASRAVERGRARPLGAGAAARVLRGASPPRSSASASARWR